MSNKVSVLVYSRRFGSPIRKAVMVYFAERASDNGEGIWASKATIANAIECGRSTVIRTVKDFVAEGLLSEVGKRPCRNGETVEYAINLDAVAALDLANDVPERDQSQSGTSPRAGRDQSQSGTPTSPAAGPKPSVGTIKEPSESRETPVDVLCKIVRHETAVDFAAHRKAMKKPLTHEAARRLVSKLANHPDPDAVFDLSIENGWQGVFPEKVVAGASRSQPSVAELFAELDRQKGGR